MDRKDFTVALVSPAAEAGTVVVALDCEALLGTVAGLSHARFDGVDAGFLASVNPGLIIVPLFAANYDAAMAVDLLEDLGYLGRIAVLAPILPRPRLVERELRSLGPGERLVLISP